MKKQLMQRPCSGEKLREQKRAGKSGKQRAREDWYDEVRWERQVSLMVSEEMQNDPIYLLNNHLTALTMCRALF